ncbi:Holliday junction resolvase RuvX [Nakamurella endophytica]|uniref:Holliday junction resolvase RuvX n=1 Tax=Nakamurella endophytica TaxID=1748367 RepID=UPI001E44A705|nr:Holliday junction resolvase RuvX [Nakamurella endophytica]
MDVGTVRVGAALSDPHGILATPAGVLARDQRAGTDLQQLADLVADNEVVEVIVGLPRTLQGTEGPAAQAARAYARLLAERIHPVPVVFVDERMTTAIAHRALAERGVRSRARRTVVDQHAAVTILQTRLEELRRAGSGPESGGRG